MEYKYMIFFDQIILFFLSSINTILNDELKSKSLKDIIYERNANIIKNAELKIGYIEFKFKKADFKKIKVLKEMFELYNILKSEISSFPCKTWASITIYDHHKLKKIREDEITKIIRYILKCKENEKISYSLDCIFKLDIMSTKIDIKDGEFFDLLLKNEEFNLFKAQSFIPCTYYFLIYEDISKNDTIKESVCNKLRSFFNNFGKISHECLDTFILLIGSFKKLDFSLRKEICQEVNKCKEINTSLIRISFNYIKTNDEHNSYQIITYNFRLYKKDNKDYFSPNQNVKKSIFKKSYKLDRNKEKPNLLNHFVFSTYIIFFEIKKVEYEMNSGEKLLNFLGYGPIINKFRICLSTLKDCKIKINFDVLVLIEKNEFYSYNYNEKREKYFTKKIIISRVLEDSITEIINFSYDINNEELVGFPLTTVESLEVEKLSEGNNLEAKKLANFINLYQSFVYCCNYFYFYFIFQKELCFTENICLYRREVQFDYISKSNIKILTTNSCKYKNNILLTRKHAILKSVKSINVFYFERNILNRLNSKGEKHYHNVLKGLRNHYIDQIELKFYDNVKNFNLSHLSRENDSINFFINIDFGLNREYLILFKESSYKNTGCKEYYDIKFLHENVFETLGSDFSKIIPSLDLNSLQNQLKLFTNSILEIIKEDLFDNIEIEDGLVFKLKSDIDSFPPELHKTILNYCNICDDTENKEINGKNMEKNIIFEKLLNKLILIIRESFIEKRYESCVLASLANEKNESDLILQSLLQND